MRSIRYIFPLCCALATGAGLHAQYLEEFDSPAAGPTPGGWSCTTGDGQATVQFIQQDGYATVHVDATSDRENIWWAVIRTPVPGLDMRLLMDGDHELRAEARIRTSHAPRRVNLHFNHQRTTDFHSHLMEYDIPEPGKWHTISMTTRGFEVEQGDRIHAQMALMDWGLEQYRVDIDYFRVDVVEASAAGPDMGNPIPYHPPVPDPESFQYALPVDQDAMVDRRYPDMNFNDWETRWNSADVPILAVGGSQLVLLRWDTGKYTGRTAAGPGLLELTTLSLQRSPSHAKDFGMVRIKEILGGHPDWNQETVTLASFLDEALVEQVINPQMVIDYPVNPAPLRKSFFIINRQVMNRLLSGRTRGLAIEPLGAVNAAFLSSESADSSNHPKLLFNLE